MMGNIHTDLQNMHTKLSLVVGTWEIISHIKRVISRFNITQCETSFYKNADYLIPINPVKQESIIFSSYTYLLNN